MGVYYTIYAEVRLGENWYSFDSFVLKMDGQYELVPILSGKSYVGELFDHLDQCDKIRFSELAEATQKHITKQIYEEHRDGLHEKTFDAYDFYSEIKPKRKREYQYEYFVLRYYIAAYETGEIDEIESWLTAEEYRALPQDEQKEYTFFRWSDNGGWYDTLLKVICKVETRLQDFYDEVVFLDPLLSQYTNYTNPVRLITIIN